MPTITISDALYKELQALAGGAFVTTVPEVIEQLLEAWKRKEGRSAAEKNTGHTESSEPHRLRRPRERGIEVTLEGSRISAVSVPDLYEQVGSALLAGGYSKKLRELDPFSTSSRRFLYSSKGLHPTGAHFVQPVKIGPFVMEAHKDYKNALAHLTKLCEKLGVSLDY
ncbi:MAG: hypothetical protein KGJ96_05135 [Xanthomonadaceae bacterium]|jgi:predicted CopG family antitoxin|nr:hypothetical protein [Xanthomonadaceae bacterium]MDE2247944.1 hypothetical protein [Xanthomonadaceae bacterium]